MQSMVANLAIYSSNLTIFALFCIFGNQKLRFGKFLISGNCLALLENVPIKFCCMLVPYSFIGNSTIKNVHRHLVFILGNKYGWMAIVMGIFNT